MVITVKEFFTPKDPTWTRVGDSDFGTAGAQPDSLSDSSCSVA